MLTDEISARAEALIQAFSARQLMVATAESCTGGLVAGALTAIAGSSAVVERGFVTYSNQAKTDMLGVPENVLATHGAVSEPVARAMASGALERSRAALAVSVTGIAGPGGGSEQKPVGLVHFACAAKDARVHHIERRFGDLGRNEIRRLSVLQAFALLQEVAGP